MLPRLQGAGAAKVSVLVCDDHPLVRSALSAAVAEAVPDEPVLAARDFPESWCAAEAASDLSLCVVDLHMPGASPREGLIELRRRAPHAKLIVVTGSESDDDLVAALELGVDGYVPKTAEPGVADAAIRLVIAGGRYLPPRVAQLLAAPRRRAVADALGRGAHGERISERQRQVLGLLAEGRSNKEIAEALLLSPATVKTHVAHLLSALGVANRTEAALSARAQGLV